MQQLLGAHDQLSASVLQALGNALQSSVAAGDYALCVRVVQCVLAWLGTVTQPSLNVVSAHATQVRGCFMSIHMHVLCMVMDVSTVLLCLFQL